MQGLSARRGVAVLATTTFGILGPAGVASASTANGSIHSTISAAGSTNCVSADAELCALHSCRQESSASVAQAVGKISFVALVSGRSPQKPDTDLRSSYTTGGSQTDAALHAKGLLHAGSGLTHSDRTVLASPKLHAKGLLHAGSALAHAGGVISGPTKLHAKGILQIGSGLTPFAAWQLRLSGSTAARLHPEGVMRARSGATHASVSAMGSTKLHAKGLLHAGSGLTHADGTVLALNGATSAPAIAQAHSSRALMACLNARTDSSNVFRSAPLGCALHFANKPFDGNDIAPVVEIRWSGWGGSVAQGCGTFHGNMDYTAPSTIVVSRPRRCANGTQNYTWASITTGGIDSASGPLTACPALAASMLSDKSPSTPGHWRVAMVNRLVRAWLSSSASTAGNVTTGQGGARGASPQMYSSDPSAGTRKSKHGKPLKNVTVS